MDYDGFILKKRQRDALKKHIKYNLSNDLCASATESTSERLKRFFRGKPGRTYHDITIRLLRAVKDHLQRFQLLGHANRVKEARRANIIDRTQQDGR